MKKQILALCALVLAGSLSTLAAKTSSEQLIDFETMELGPKGHKAQWFDLMKKCDADKFELLKRQHAAKAALEIEYIKALSAMEDVSHAAREKYDKDKLDAKIALHEKQTAEWEKMCKTHVENEMKLVAKHKDELAKFKAQL
jgi:hypothetical protein